MRAALFASTSAFPTRIDGSVRSHVKGPRTDRDPARAALRSSPDSDGLSPTSVLKEDPEILDTLGIPQGI